MEWYHSFLSMAWHQVRSSTPNIHGAGPPVLETGGLYITIRWQFELSYELNLQNNSFAHEIPREIGHLQRLRNLNMNNNSTIGKIPNISSCSNLIALRFSRNQLQGDVPMELGALSTLQVLHISHNNLTGNMLNLLHHGAFKSFKAECEALRNIRQRNLVKVLTACSSTDYHDNDSMDLVYEFMVNGSLEEWLHPAVDTADQAEMATRSSNLLQRLNIVIVLQVHLFISIITVRYQLLIAILN